MKSDTNIILNIWIAASCLASHSEKMILIMMALWLVLAVFESFYSWKEGDLWGR